MERENRFGFGDVLIGVAILMMIMKWAGILTASWVAINRFNVLTIIYLVVCFFIDTTIKVIDSAIAKKRDE